MRPNCPRAEPVVLATLGRMLARSRRRRLLFVLALMPALALALVVGPALRSPGLMALGLCLAALAVGARALSEPWFLPGTPSPAAPEEARKSQVQETP